ISTAAGETILPVRGSSSRAAFTTVNAFGVWPASRDAGSRAKSIAAKRASRLRTALDEINRARTDGSIIKVIGARFIGVTPLKVVLNQEALSIFVSRASQSIGFV